MLTFSQWIMEARQQPDEEHSWIWHPVHGVHSRPGYMQHGRIMDEKPDFRKLASYKDGNETEKDYDPPRGYVRVDRAGKKLHYTRYDQSKYAVAGTKDSADAKEVDKHVRAHHNVPADFKSLSHSDSKWWHNSGNMEFKQRS